MTGGEKSLHWGNVWKPCRLLSALGGRRGQRSRGEAASGLHLRASGRVPPAFSLLRPQALTLASHVSSSSSHLYSFSKKSHLLNSSHSPSVHPTGISSDFALEGFAAQKLPPVGAFFLVWDDISPPTYLGTRMTGVETLRASLSSQPGHGMQGGAGVRRR